jgi:hypothetical protein
MELTDHEKEMLKHALSVLDDAIANDPFQYTEEDRDAVMSLTVKLGGIGVW